MKYIISILAVVLLWGCSPKDSTPKTENAPAPAAENIAAAPELEPITEPVEKIIKDEIIGTWMKPVEGQEGYFDGIAFVNNGSMETINMSTITYKSWTRDGKNLTVTALSEGNGQGEMVTLNYKIKKLTKETLVLELDGAEFTFTRENN